MGSHDFEMGTCVQTDYRLDLTQGSMNTWRVEAVEVPIETISKVDRFETLLE